MSRSRRQFIKKLGGGLLGAGLVSGSLAAASPERVELLERFRKPFSPNDKIRLGAIGMGIQGFANCQAALQVPGAELVAVCDLYDGHLASSKEVFGQHLFTTRDFREIISRSDIDAVIISTPDHWHDYIAIAALEAGKAVYCEKPMVHHPEEGQAMIAAQKKAGKPVQVGSQRVSSIVYAKAKELYESGVIGQLVLAEAWYDRQSALGAWQYSIPPDASPSTIDWDRFQGDAPKQPFDKVRFFRWRNYRDYGTGMAGDLYVHLFSGLHSILSSHGPERIYASGGLRYWKDGRDVPDVQVGIFDYPETDRHPAFNLQLRCNFVDGKGGDSAVRLVGSDGVMELGWNSVKITRHPMEKQPGYGGWDTYETFTQATKKAFEEWYKEAHPAPPPVVQEPEVLEYRAPRDYNEHVDHHANFLDAVRHGTPVVEDATFGLRAAGPSLAANISYFEGHPVRWDPEKMMVVK